MEFILTWPREETIRQMVSRVTDLNFAPTIANKEALLKENISPDSIHVVGNTVIDALSCLSEETIESSKEFFTTKGITTENLVLITAHRRENHGERLDEILRAIKYLVTKFVEHTFVVPVHPNPNVKTKIETELGQYKNVKLLAPLDYPNLVYLMKHAKLILTDSGGIQEEAPTFNCPTIVLRYETERKEGVEAGVSVLVGADYEKILANSEPILAKTISETRLKTQNPYGDGVSAKRIEQIIRNFFN